MIYLKSCQRCQGDVHYYNDTWGSYMKCLQCGQTWNSRKSEERADLEAELAADANAPDLVAVGEHADIEEEFEDPFEEPIEEPNEIRRAS